MVAERSRERRSTPPAVCRNGHRQTYRVTSWDSLGRWRCGTCAAEWARELARRQAGVLASRCRRGHPREAGNLLIRPDGRRECRICRREYDRARKRESRARARAGATQRPKPPRDRPGSCQKAVGADMAPEATVRPVEPSSPFDAIVAGYAAKVREVRAAPIRFGDAIRAGERARAEREARQGAAVPPIAVTGTPRIDALFRAAADLCHVDAGAIRARSRLAPALRARRLTIHALHERGLSNETIAGIVKRDRWSVGSMLATVARLVAAGDPDTLRDLAAIRASLAEAAG